ncbi:MAG: hypothetical protein GEU71_15780 [Actinobacteria bacterium]|nr:hypothetical protein [Actinomycetota bacterium]
MNSVKRSVIALVIVALGLFMAPAPSALAFTGHGCKVKNCKFFTSSYNTAVYFYNRKTCGQWKSLSKTYLHGFKSKKALKKKFPARKLHSPC